ncbi:MAG: tryptophan synthase subunit alpha [Lutibacter sp.]|jgi:tryptophan synthase alpha chain|uniref:tryptophan synthase subunit alpha n=1 Tax=Lutibacter sp. TaxID=1925666 RepID=UPI00299D9D42|nr:tryptophan synthase subunit alpha [Lutibacter sp.]MDX1829025.1 tryptophan synthase subunit alpha [Lutibacter sp.]
MSKLTSLFKTKQHNLCSVFFTAGFPKLNDTEIIIKSLENNGVDFLEVGLPYSDPLADGPTIQHSSSIALKNGINLDIIFNQLESLKDTIKIPLILMGYLNQVIKYGEVKFCQRCKECGIETVIIPDLPMIEYDSHYQQLFANYGITNVFLITPQTSEERILKIDKITNAFIYVVASSSITGAKGEISSKQIAYFERIKKMNLKSTLIAGFGISNKTTFDTACKYVNGAIIGSAFINFLQENGTETISKFVEDILN